MVGPSDVWNSSGVTAKCVSLLNSGGPYRSIADLENKTGKTPQNPMLTRVSAFSSIASTLCSHFQVKTQRDTKRQGDVWKKSGVFDRFSGSKSQLRLSKSDGFARHYWQRNIGFGPPFFKPFSESQLQTSNINQLGSGGKYGEAEHR